MQTKLTEELSQRKKKIHFRCWHRGTREMDLILGQFADQNLSLASDDHIAFFETLLSYSDTEIYHWITKKNQDIPNELKHPLFYQLIEQAGNQ